MPLLTIGYAGRDLEGFLETLARANVTDLVDVRYTAISHKKGFSKTALCSAVENVGIQYHHQRFIGVPKALRKQLETVEGFATFTRSYLTLLNDRSAELAEIAALAREGRCCLLCVEADVERCHRGLLATRIEIELGTDTEHL